jgi:hypothetical protein
MSIKRLAILDDYQGVALSMGPWDKLPGLEVTVFRDTITDRAALVQRLAPFDAILAATARSTRRPVRSAASPSAARRPSATRPRTSPGG